MHMNSNLVAVVAMLVATGGVAHAQAEEYACGIALSDYEAPQINTWTNQAPIDAYYGASVDICARYCGLNAECQAFMWGYDHTVSRNTVCSLLADKPTASTQLLLSDVSTYTINCTNAERECQVGEWSTFSDCSNSCGAGQQFRTRTVEKLGTNCEALEDMQECFQTHCYNNTNQEVNFTLRPRAGSNECVGWVRDSNYVRLAVTSCTKPDSNIIPLVLQFNNPTAGVLQHVGGTIDGRSSCVDKRVADPTTPPTTHQGAVMTPCSNNSDTQRWVTEHASGPYVLLKENPSGNGDGLCLHWDGTHGLEPNNPEVPNGQLSLRPVSLRTCDPSLVRNQNWQLVPLHTDPFEADAFSLWDSFAPDTTFNIFPTSDPSRCVQSYGGIDRLAPDHCNVNEAGLPGTGPLMFQWRNQRWRAMDMKAELLEGTARCLSGKSADGSLFLQECSNEIDIMSTFPFPTGQDIRNRAHLGTQGNKSMYCMEWDVESGDSWRNGFDPAMQVGRCDAAGTDTVVDQLGNPQDYDNGFSFILVTPDTTTCEVGDWSSYSTCTDPCGGYRERTREVTGFPVSTGCPHLVERIPCNSSVDECNCVYGEWSEFSTCSEPCGPGTHTRTREVESGDASCKDQTQRSTCNMGSCSEECVVSEWTGFGECSRTCTEGLAVSKATEHTGNCTQAQLEKVQRCNVGVNLAGCRELTFYYDNTDKEGESQVTKTLEWLENDLHISKAQLTRLPTDTRSGSPSVFEAYFDIVDAGGNTASDSVQVLSNALQNPKDQFCVTNDLRQMDIDGDIEVQCQGSDCLLLDFGPETACNRTCTEGFTERIANLTSGQCTDEQKKIFTPCNQNVDLPGCSLLYMRFEKFTRPIGNNDLQTEIVESLDAELSMLTLLSRTKSQVRVRLRNPTPDQRGETRVIETEDVYFDIIDGENKTAVEIINFFKQVLDDPANAAFRSLLLLDATLPNSNGPQGFLGSSFVVDEGGVPETTTTKTNQESLIIGVVVGSAALVALVAGFVLYRRHRAAKNRDSENTDLDSFTVAKVTTNSSDGESAGQDPLSEVMYGSALGLFSSISSSSITAHPSQQQMTDLSILKTLEIDQTKITYGKQLGSGHFGVVYQATLDGKAVAAKTLRPDVGMAGGNVLALRKKFLEEAAAMATMKSPYIVRLIGVHMRSEPFMMIMEFLPLGNLRDYLRENRGHFQPDDYLRYAWQIAKGMAHLERLRFVHRDLAARNVLMADPFTVKVTDFGLARDVYERDYYSLQGQRELPVQWMAPESLADARFTSKSDVWAFAITTFEIFSEGEQPWPGVSPHHLLNFIRQEHRPQLSRNSIAADEYHRIVDACFVEDPDMRPNFVDLVQNINELFDEHVNGRSSAASTFVPIQGKRPASDLVSDASTISADRNDVGYFDMGTSSLVPTYAHPGHSSMEDEAYSDVAMSLSTAHHSVRDSPGRSDADSSSSNSNSDSLRHGSRSNRSSRNGGLPLSDSKPDTPPSKIEEYLET
eukprot:Clim_evm21s247 gene=Clim_evmTU21s247